MCLLLLEMLSAGGLPLLLLLSLLLLGQSVAAATANMWPGVVVSAAIGNTAATCIGLLLPPIGNLAMRMAQRAGGRTRRRVCWTDWLRLGRMQGACSLNGA